MTAAIAGYSIDTWGRAFPGRVARLAMVRDAGVLERRNPLPAATYWKDVFEADAPKFNEWLRANRETVRLKTTEHIDGDPPRDWVLFDVLGPTEWGGPGYPDIATPNVRTSADTVQAPLPEPPDNDPFGLKKTVPWIVFGVAAVATIAVLK